MVVEGFLLRNTFIQAWPTEWFLSDVRNASLSPAYNIFSQVNSTPSGKESRDTLGLEAQNPGGS